MPDQYRLKIDDRPVVFVYGGHPWYTNLHCFSDMLAAVRDATADYIGVVPYIIVEESWQTVDSDGGFMGDTLFRWFTDPSVDAPQEYDTLTGSTADKQVGLLIPGYDGTLFQPTRGKVDRCADTEGNQTGNSCTAQADTRLDYGMRRVAEDAELVLIESINNVEENAHIIDTTTWGARELSTTLWWTTNHP